MHFFHKCNVVYFLPKTNQLVECPIAQRLLIEVGLLALLKRCSVTWELMPLVGLYLLSHAFFTDLLFFACGLGDLKGVGERDDVTTKHLIPLRMTLRFPLHIVRLLHVLCFVFRADSLFYGWYEHFNMGCLWPWLSRPAKCLRLS